MHFFNGSTSKGEIHRGGIRHGLREV